MAEAATTGTLSLSEQYLLEREKGDVGSKLVEVKEVVKPETAISEEKAEEVLIAAAAEEKVEDTAAAEESSETNPAAENKSEDAPAVETESSETTEENSDEQGAADEKPEIKLETAPADFRFPTTNQTRHCFTRYIEYHRCVAAKGEGASECEKYGKYYRSLCPTEWIERWNEQRENGTFPGPL
ncbi:cytochrome c oxidase subunit 6b-1 [Manihot esculenta]|uniref:Annexin n=2 Tax=Manihot esculenta TaxID=3983 RepID=A0A2C9U177_MANES|nr:cytochrome c oxidase subunit 6b-1 [Manihot esculenta]OAY23307.2 hypothetical protein MANES_18G064621v8 [Manihot esculenta]